ncbi:MAG: glycosyltransferase [Syntrophaceae bacterium]|nr:glycosyltransferase [Syntrophaceae bacterium]
MRVLHIIDSGGLYGAEMMLLSLAEEQVKLGLEPIIASLGEKRINKKPFELEAIKRGLDIALFRMAPGLNITGALTVLRFAKSRHVGILHSHGYKGNILFGFIPFKFRGIPMLSTVHGYTSVSGLSKMRIYEALDIFSHKFIEAVVLVNKGMLSNAKLADRKGVTYHVINNGIPVLDNTADSHDPIGNTPIKEFCTKKKIIIGSIGRLSTEKGFRHLIDALSIVRGKGIDAGLLIIGEGYQRSTLQKFIETSSLSDHVIMPGYFENAKRFLSYFDIYAIPSLTEGLPITLLEAMQARVPVIASHVGGIPFVLENETGYLFAPARPEAISDAIISVVNNREAAREKAEKAYRHFVANFSSLTMAENYRKLYNRLCA